MAFVSFRCVTDSEKSLRSAFLIKFFVMFLYNLLSVQLVPFLAVFSHLSGFHNFWSKPER